MLGEVSVVLVGRGEGGGSFVDESSSFSSSSTSSFPFSLLPPSSPLTVGVASSLVGVVSYLVGVATVGVASFGFSSSFNGFFTDKSCNDSVVFGSRHLYGIE